MPDEMNELSDDMELRLRAFGRTLEERTGEPIAGRSTVAGTAASVPSRRWWALAGAAACLVAVVGALAFVIDRGGDDSPPAVSPSRPWQPEGWAAYCPEGALRTVAVDTGPYSEVPEAQVAIGAALDEVALATGVEFATDAWQWSSSGEDEVFTNVAPAGQWAAVLIEPSGDGVIVSAATVCTAPTTAVEVAMMPAIDDDPLGLVADGWVLVQNDRIDGWIVDDAMTCAERIDATTLGGLPVARHVYRLDDDRVEATFIEVGNAAALTWRLRSMTDPLTECTGDSNPVDPLSVGGGMGYRVGGRTVVAVRSGQGGAVILAGPDARVDDALVERAAAFLDASAADDPLGLVRDGWTLVERSDEPLELGADGAPCPAASALGDLGSLPQTRDVVIPPDVPELDVDVQIVEVGSLERGHALADAVQMVGRCLQEQGMDVETTSLSSIRATWFRAGGEFALLTVVGEGSRSVVIEIEGFAFTDFLIADLAHRASQFLNGQPVTGAPADTPVATTTLPPRLQMPGVGADPLALERDGWTLVERGTAPFAAAGVPCGSTMAELDGAPQVHDILTPPEGTGLDLDLTIVQTDTPDRGRTLASGIAEVAGCASESQGVGVGTAALADDPNGESFRVGPEFALVVVAGPERTVLFEIEGAEFGDDLIVDLARRAEQFLTGQAIDVVEPTPADVVATTTLVAQPGPFVDRGPAVGDPQVDPRPGEVQLWVSNQSFQDDPVELIVRIDGVPVVSELFRVEGQHNWQSWLVAGLADGEHTITAESDTGVTETFEFTLPAGEPRWLVVDYWTDTEAAEPRFFTLNESSEPVSFS